MLQQDCTFCKIVDGDISARIISQNDNAIAFLDSFPLSVGHTLIIPKRHYYKLQDMNREYSSAIFDLLRVVTTAVEKAAGAKASTIANSMNGNNLSFALIGHCIFDYLLTISYHVLIWFMY
jgi:histidine triad (HIT) family protein